MKLAWIWMMVAAQASSAAQSEFDVASIKLNTTSGGGAYIQALPGRLVLTNFSLRQLIQSAYGVHDYQLSGDPSWASSEHYDIQATASGNAEVKQMEGSMLRALLEARFKLALHRETRQLPVYELTVAKGGLKMPLTKEGGCTPYSMDASPPPSSAPGAPRPVFCGFPRFGIDGMTRTLDGAGIHVAELAASLSRTELHRTVIDKAGLTEAFDVHLKWVIDTSTDSAAADTPNGPSIFNALQEQLGLKLESTKGPVELLVIDHVEKPSEN